MNSNAESHSCTCMCTHYQTYAYMCMIKHVYTISSHTVSVVNYFVLFIHRVKLFDLVSSQLSRLKFSLSRKLLGPLHALAKRIIIPESAKLSLYLVILQYFHNE